MAVIRQLALDEYNLPRADFIKLDVEGMELDALQGANKTIERSRPILLVEKIKSNPEQISRWFSDRGYLLREVGINILAVHSDDKVRAEIIPAPPRNDNWRIGPAQIQISLHCRFDAVEPNDADDGCSPRQKES